MAYSLNPYLPKLRAQAVEMVVQGKSIREVARHFGVAHSAVWKWVHGAPQGRVSRIPTQSSRPNQHPRELPEEIVERIRAIRLEHGRCAEVIHRELQNKGIVVSLSSVKRTIERCGLIKKRSPWKRLHRSTSRPQILIPGSLVELDTIHLMQDRVTRIYVYTLIDVFSRWVHARATERISAKYSVQFVRQATRKAPFSFSTLQSDHGPEFSTHFTERIHIPHRHSRVRQPDDNAHIERFNRTIQDEFLDALPRDVKRINRELPGYLHYYNTKRLHLGIHLKTPSQLL